MLKTLETVTSRRSLYVILLLLVGLYVGWLLSLPAWPSQDGPVHLYYTTVLDALFSKAPSPFQPYFFIKHLLPPYALYYYALLGLSHVVPLLLADRLVICLYVVLFVLGFRYLALALGSNAEVTSLLASVLVLNWALGMGFANYCLSLALAFWAMGLWVRMKGGPGERRRRVCFVLLTLVITLTHPVPLLLVLGFCGLDLLCRFLVGRGSGKRELPVRKLVTLGCSALCLLYVKAFTTAHPLAQRTVEPGSLGDHLLRRVEDLLIVKNVELLYGHWWAVMAYRVGLGLVLVAATVMTGLRWRQRRAEPQGWTAADTMTVFAGCFLLGLPWLPSDLSGAYYFFERLNLLLWLTMLLAASAWVPGRRAASGPGRGWVTDARREWLTAALALGFTAAFTALLLVAANRTLRPFAERDFRLAHTVLPLEGQMAVVLDGGPERKYLYAGPAWDPYYWDTVALLRHNGGLMVNAPWLDSPIIPLAKDQAFPGIQLSPILANSPEKLDRALPLELNLRTDVLNRSSVAFFSPVPTGAGAHTVPSVLDADWSCRTDRGAGYILCMRRDDGTADLARNGAE